MISILCRSFLFIYSFNWIKYIVFWKISASKRARLAVWHLEDQPAAKEKFKLSILSFLPHPKLSLSLLLTFEMITEIYRNWDCEMEQKREENCVHTTFSYCCCVVSPSTLIFSRSLRVACSIASLLFQYFFSTLKRLLQLSSMGYPHCAR